jgi:hypothetical protein
MTISELIAALEVVRDQHGDLPVYVWDDWYDFALDRLGEQHAIDDAYASLVRPVRVVLYSEQS